MMKNIPWTDSRQREDAGIPVSPNAPFFLLHHPNQWELIQEEGKEPEWLPSFSTLKEIPGVQGVKQHPKGGADSRQARVDAMDRGFLVIDRDLGYLTRWPCKGGGFYYDLIFTNPKEVAGRVLWKTDSLAFNEFKRSLVESGYIDPPDPDILDLKIDDIKNRIGRHIQNQHLPEVKTKLEELRAMIQAMEKAKNPKKRKKK